MLSLNITDEEMYSEFIKPWHDEKALKPLIYDLLKAYYSNEQFRAEADKIRYGVTEDDSIPDDVDSLNDSFKDLLADARQSLAMMTVVTEQFEGSVESSLETILDMVGDTIDNSKARSEQEFHDDSILKLGMQTEVHDINSSSTSSFGSSSSNTSKNGNLDSDLAYTEADITSLVTKVVDERMSTVESELRETRGSIDDIMAMLRVLTSSGVRQEATEEVDSKSSEASDILPEFSNTPEVSSVVSSDDIISAEESSLTITSDAETKTETDELDLFSDSDEGGENFEDASTVEDDIVDDYDESEEEGFSALTAFLNNGVGFSETV